jgi:hypothetical protein
LALSDKAQIGAVHDEDGKGLYHGLLGVAGSPGWSGPGFCHTALSARP